MNEKSQIILCQPDGKKGCSACCGLFNHRDITRESLSGFLSEGNKRLSDDFSEMDVYSPSWEVRDRTSHICSYQGFLSEGRPGCLLHPMVRGKDLRDRSLFGSRICEAFLCPAHEILPAHARETLIRYVNDWFLYTISIIDPESFMWILDELIARSGYESLNENFPGWILTGAIDIHAWHLEKYDGGIFFYSRHEYSLEKHRFTLASREGEREAERRDIREYIRDSLNE